MTLHRSLDLMKFERSGPNKPARFQLSLRGLPLGEMDLHYDKPKPWIAHYPIGDNSRVIGMYDDREAAIKAVLEAAGITDL